MKNIVLLLFIVSSESIAQSGTVPSILRSQITMDEMARGPVKSSTTLYGIPLRPPGFDGNFYLDEKWSISTIMLYDNDKLLEGYLSRFHLKSNFLEIRTDNGIRVLDVGKIKSLVCIDSLTTAPRYFINAKDYKINNSRLEGLLEVVVDGKSPLFKFVSVIVKKPDYNIALDVGNKDYKILKREIYYCAVDKNLIEFKGKRSLDKAFTDETPMIKNFIKKNNLTYTKEWDWVRIFRFYNEPSK